MQPSDAATPVVRTFKRRSRIRPAQEAALGDLWPRFGAEPDGAPGKDPLDLAAVFGRRAPVVLEIGFGRGEATLAMAAADPGRDVLAVDVHRAGAGALLLGLDRAGLSNVRVLVGDAVPVLRDRLAPGALDEVRIFFPDPWPKSRHHKRRLVTPATVALLASRLRPGGRLHCATDWEPYADEMLAAVGAEPLLHNASGGFAPRPAWRPVTRFEQQGLDKGHVVRDVVATRID